MGMLVNPFSVVPSGPTDPNFTLVTFLGHMNGTNGSTTIVNSCPRGTTASCNGTAALSTTSPQFGTAALSVTGAATSYVTTGSSADYTIGTGDFTLEASIYTGTPSQNGGIVGGDQTNKLGMYISGSALLFRSDNSTLVNGGTILTNTWQRLAVGRNGTTCRGWVDGIQVGTITSGVSFNLTSMRIGTDFGIGFFFFNGKIDEVRLTKGACRWTGNYTVDAAEFPDS